MVFIKRNGLPMVQETTHATALSPPGGMGRRVWDNTDFFSDRANRSPPFMPARSGWNSLTDGSEFVLQLHPPSTVGTGIRQVAKDAMPAPNVACLLMMNPASKPCQLSSSPMMDSLLIVIVP